MKLVVIGAGQGGSNIADEFVRLAKWIWKERRIRILSGGRKDPLTDPVFSMNLGGVDLYGLQNIRDDEDHCILLGSEDNLRGRGAGMDNAVGAEQALKGKDKIRTAVNSFGHVYTADAILVIATTAGGTGSGSVGVIVDLLKDEWPDKPVYAMLVLPFVGDYDNPRRVLNTASCLKRVIDNSKADAVILVDNKKFVRRSENMNKNFEGINERVVNAFMDLLCAGEEENRKFISNVLDASDVNGALISTGSGASIAVIGMSQAELPKRGIFSGRKKTREGGGQHFSLAKEQTELALGVVREALDNLSADCESSGDQGKFYDAEHVLGLFSGPINEATEEIVGAMETFLSTKVPGASRWMGTYPGRTSNTVSVTVIISGVGKGAATDLINWFYEEGKKSQEELQKSNEERDNLRSQISSSASDLPNLDLEEGG